MNPDIYSLTHRESFGYWLNENNIIGSGAEIGCAYGHLSRTILSKWKGETLYMVDPWVNLPNDEYREEHSSVNYEAWYDECVKLSQQDTRIKIVRKRSVEAAQEFQPLSLDWVYIDANHDYGFVMQDMDAWFPKVRVGGIICGHDFYNAKESGHWCGVADAVIRWMGEHNKVFTVTPCSSWWCIK